MTRRELRFVFRKIFGLEYRGRIKSQSCVFVHLLCRTVFTSNPKAAQLRLIIATLKSLTPYFVKAVPNFREKKFFVVQAGH